MVENGEGGRWRHPLEPQRQIAKKQESLTSAAIEYGTSSRTAGLDRGRLDRRLLSCTK
jgi:hypothetical protein